MYLIVVVVRIADLSGDLQSCDERAAGRAYAIEEKVTCGPAKLPVLVEGLMRAWVLTTPFEKSKRLTALAFN